MLASSSRLVASRARAVLRVARQRLQGARLPVDPGGVLLLGRRHRVDRLHHLLPAAAGRCRHAARSAPSRPACRRRARSRVRSCRGRWVGAQELVGGLGLQLDRGLAGDAGPSVGGEVAGQGPLPAAGEQGGGGVAVGGRQPDERDRRELGVAARRGRRLLREVARRAVEDRRHAGGDRVGEQVGSLARSARPVGLDAGADLLPDLGARRSAEPRPSSLPRKAQPSSPSFCASQAAMPASFASLPLIGSPASAKHVTSRSSFMRKRGNSAAKLARSRRRTSSSSQSLRRRSST